MSDSSQPLKNQRQEKFALLVSKGKTAREAYMAVYKVKTQAADAAASRMLSSTKPYEGRVLARVQWLKTQSASRSALTMQERRDFLARVVRANPKTINLETDGDLLEEFTTEENGKIRFRLPSKRGCVMDDARLAGELIDRQDLTTDGEALPAAMPVIQMNVPPSFVTRRTGQQEQRN
jgi:hypothetical protein